MARTLDIFSQPVSGLGIISRDLSHSCVFDFPDRPNRPVPPVPDPSDPPGCYPWCPGDWWPHIPPPPIPPPDIPPDAIPYGVEVIAMEVRFGTGGTTDFANLQARSFTNATVTEYGSWTDPQISNYRGGMANEDNFVAGVTVGRHPPIAGNPCPISLGDFVIYTQSALSEFPGTLLFIVDLSFSALQIPGNQNVGLQVFAVYDNDDVLTYHTNTFVLGGNTPPSYSIQLYVHRVFGSYIRGVPPLTP